VLVLGLTAPLPSAGASAAKIKRVQLIQASTGHSKASSLKATFAATSSAHSLLVLIASSDGPEVQAQSVTDDGGNAWRLATQIGFGLQGSFETQFWYAWNTAPALSATIDYGTFTGHLAMDLAEYSGAARAADPLDGFSTGSTGISGEECSTPYVPNHVNDLAVGAAGTAPTRKMALADPFKAVKQARVGKNSVRSGYAILPSQELVMFDATWTEPAAYDCVMILFQPR
jgi:hypothetical protein